jgi:hypothetical protein
MKIEYKRANGYVTEINSGRRVISMVSELNRLVAYLELRDMKIKDLEQDIVRLTARLELLTTKHRGSHG